MSTSVLLVLLALVMLVGSTHIPRENWLTDNMNRSYQHTDSITIFQFLEESYFSLWCNWITLALSLQVFDHYPHTQYYLSCMGSPALNKLVQLYYTPGCQAFEKATPETTKKIFLSKWCV